MFYHLHYYYYQFKIVVVVVAVVAAAAVVVGSSSSSSSRSRSHSRSSSSIVVISLSSLISFLRRRWALPPCAARGRTILTLARNGYEGTSCDNNDNNDDTNSKHTNNRIFRLNQQTSNKHNDDANPMSY